MRTNKLFIAAFVAVNAILSACSGTATQQKKSSAQAEADSLTDVMYEHYDAFDYAKAVEIGTDALKRYEALGDSTAMSDVMGAMCIAYLRLGNVAEGLEMSQKAITLDSIMGDNELLSGDYNNVAGLYLSEDKAAEAEPFILKAIEYEKKTPEQSHLSNRYGNAS